MNDPSMPPRLPRQRPMPLRATAALAGKMMSARRWRALLVALSVALAVAFLASVAAREAFEAEIARRGADLPPALAARLEQRGELPAGDSAAAASLPAGSTADRRVRSRWLLAIALMIAFVGILNAMVMSVAERAAEIGTLKCLGATDRTVVALYLIEGAALGAIGSVAGAVAGGALAYAEGFASYGTAVFVLIAPGALAAGAAGAVALGTALAVAGSIYPAWTAARLDPAAALRANF